MGLTSIDHQIFPSAQKQVETGVCCYQAQNMTTLKKQTKKQKQNRKQTKKNFGPSKPGLNTAGSRLY